MHFLRITTYFHPFSLRNRFDLCSATHRSRGVPLGQLEELLFLLQSKKKLIISGDLFFFEIFQYSSFRHAGLLLPSGNSIYVRINLEIYIYPTSPRFFLAEPHAQKIDLLRKIHAFFEDHHLILFVFIAK